VLWILSPIIIALVLFIFRQRETAINIAGFTAALIFAILAWIIPIGESITILPLPGFPTLQISDSITISGRSLTLDDSTKPLLIFIYLSITFWLGGAYATSINRLFIPLSLIIAALLTASLSVQPFLFSAVMIVLVILTCVVIFSPPSKIPKEGIIRFFTYGTLGMPFLLIAGTLLAAYEFNPDNRELLWSMTLLMGLGFMFITAILPFHSWIPMVTSEVHPYAFGFVLYILPASATLLSIEFLERINEIAISDFISIGLILLGTLMVLLGGLSAAFQTHLGRIFGFAAIFEIGLGLLALSIATIVEKNTPQSGIVFVQFPPRALGFALWALALSIFQTQSRKLYFNDLTGIGYRLPFASLGLIIANLSIAGIPILAGFPVSIALWTELSKVSLTSALLVILGYLGLIFASLRTLSVLIHNPNQQLLKPSENALTKILLVTGIILILIMGLFPNLILTILSNMALSLINLGR
jgi:formate hydrogenlyase subunit 3/multisubunit Na+/H+ antiporter MnhD subunit